MSRAHFEIFFEGSCEISTPAIGKLWLQKKKSLHFCTIKMSRLRSGISRLV